MMDLAAKVLIAYLIGSISGSLVIGKLKKIDIRTLGSGNAGVTNALRTQGFAFALIVVIIDIGKGAVATMLIPELNLMVVDNPYTPLWQAISCGLAAIIGHMYPIYFGFRGGKGAATTLGALCGLAPWLLLVVIVVWSVCILLSGYVGLSTMLAMLSMIPATILWSNTSMVIFSVLASILVCHAHRSNIKRMFNHDEPQAHNRIMPLLARKHNDDDHKV